MHVFCFFLNYTQSVQARTILLSIAVLSALWGGANAYAEDFRAECRTHYSIVHRGVPTDQQSDYAWKTEIEMDDTVERATLVIINLPKRDLDWIDVTPVTSRTSRFYDGEEFSFSVMEEAGEIDVMGPQITLNTLGPFAGEWTFELMGEGRAILRTLSSTNTFDGVKIEISHGECLLSGTHSVLRRDQSSSPPEGYSDMFWNESEKAFLQKNKEPKQRLKTDPARKQ